MIVFLVLVYLFDGALIVEKTPYKNDTECRIAGGQKMDRLSRDSRFVEGYFAACLPAKAVLVEK